MHITKTITVTENKRVEPDERVTDWGTRHETYILHTSPKEDVTITREEAEQLRDLLIQLFPVSTPAKPFVPLVELTGAVKELAQRGRKIDAIKLLRDLRTMTLHDAKDAVEAWIDANPPVKPDRAQLKYEDDGY